MNLICKECDEEFDYEEHEECPYCGSYNYMVSENVEGGWIG